MTTRDDRKERSRLNKRTRGVAMVEACVVAAFLAMAFPFSVFGWKVATGRLTAINETRQVAFFDSAHNCSVTGPKFNGLTNAPVSWANPNALTLPSPANTLPGTMPGSDGQGGTLAVNHQFAMSRVQSKSSISYAPFQRSLTNTSYVFCNETPYDGHLNVWFVQGDEDAASLWRYGFP